MIVNFIEKGFMITAVELDFLPDNEDRVIIFGDTYIVDDRAFHIGKNKYVDVYVTNLSKGL
jgi:hypothetical protein